MKKTDLADVRAQYDAARRRARTLSERVRINERHYGADARPDLRVMLATERARIDRLATEIASLEGAIDGPNLVD